MKKVILTALLMFATMGASAQYTRQGNTFVAQATAKAKSEPRKTNYTYKDTDGKTYPIYVGKTGSCFIVRTSKNGNEYRASTWVRKSLSRYAGKCVSNTNQRPRGSNIPCLFLFTINNNDYESEFN